MARLCLGVVTVLLVQATGAGGEGVWTSAETVSAPARFVAVDGKADAPGTIESPWDIESALSGRQAVQPGATVYLRGGTYRRRPNELFTVALAGTEPEPIHVRPYPRERVTIDGGLSVTNPSAWLRIWDLELLVSEPNAEKPVEAGSHPESFKRPWGGLNVNGGHHCRYINLVIHHCRQGVSFWSAATDSELHGCLIYDNGWPGTDRGHGHAVYTQNEKGLKTLTDNIMTGGFSYTMHAYGSSRAYVDNYLIEGNIAYDAGPFLVGGGRPSRGIRLFRNYLYAVSMRVGYNAPENEDCDVRDNVIVNGGLEIVRFKKVLKEGNLVLRKEAPRPREPLVVLRPNKCDAGRANLVVYNFARAADVEVDVAGFLQEGETYRLQSPRDFFGKPAGEGVCRGRKITIPMKAEFAAFVLLKTVR